MREAEAKAEMETARAEKLKADQAAQEARLAQARRDEESLAAGRRIAQAAQDEEKRKRETALEAERKAERDRRYAARKARRK